MIDPIKAELTVEQFIPSLLSGLVAVVGFFIMRYIARAERDRDELIRVSAFVAVQEKENKALWRAVEDLRSKQK